MTHQLEAEQQCKTTLTKIQQCPWIWLYISISNFTVLLLSQVSHPGSAFAIHGEKVSFRCFCKWNRWASLNRSLPDCINLGAGKCSGYDEKPSPVDERLHKKDLNVSSFHVTCNFSQFNSNCSKWITTSVSISIYHSPLLKPNKAETYCIEIRHVAYMLNFLRHHQPRLLETWYRCSWKQPSHICWTSRRTSHRYLHLHSAQDIVL